MEEKKKSGRIKTSFTSKNFRNGAYSTMITAVVLAVIVVVNLLAGKIDLKMDISANRIYTLSEASRDYLKGLEDDITLYYLSVEGSEDAMIKNMVDKYAGASSHITVVQKDPNLYPTFVSKYVDVSTTQIFSDSVIVENETNGRSKYVSAKNMYLTEVDYNSMQQYQTGFDVEGQITSAIQYVTTEDLPKIYASSGHNEAALGTTINDYLGKQNMDVESFETLKAEKVPEDCSLLLINSPQYDFSEGEIEIIRTYLEGGGRAVIFNEYTTSPMTNLRGLLGSYGLQVEDGIVVETDADHMMGQIPLYLVPDVIEFPDVTSSLIRNSRYIVMIQSLGISFTDSVRSTVERTGILETSQGAFSKVNIEDSTASMTEADIPGPFYLGVLVNEDYNGANTKLAVFGSSSMISDEMAGRDFLGNAELFTNTLNWMVEREAMISIPTKSYSEQYVTLTATQSRTWSIVVIAVIPLAVLAAGLMVYLRRRKK